MAYGVPPKNTHSLPPGRRGFSESTKEIVSGSQSEIMRPGTYSDGTARDGTPKGNEHRTFAPGKSPGYMDASSKAYRAEIGSAPPSVPNNEVVSSKNDKRFGRQGSKLSGATFKSTGEQPAGQQRDDIAPSLPQVSRPRAAEHREVVGWLNGKNHPANHPNTGKHFGGHVSGAHTNTDAAAGQAHSASGGQYGKPQVRPAPTARAGVDRKTLGPLERTKYTGTK
jgi:hypothetical protein